MPAERIPIDNANQTFVPDKSSSMHWRTRFLLSTAELVVFPLLLIRFITQYYNLQYSLPSQILLSFVAISIYIYLTSRWNQFRIAQEASKLNCRTIPVAKGKWPGNLDLLLRLMRKPRNSYVAAWMYKFFQEHKVDMINLRPLGMDLILTCDHGAIKEMLAGGFGNWEKGFLLREMLFDFFGKGIFAVDGEDWKAHRVMTRPYLNKERTSDFDTFWKYGQATVDILQDVAQRPVPVTDVQDLMTRFTMDAASEFLFGKCLDTLKGRLPLPGQATMGTRGSMQASDIDNPLGDFVLSFDSAQLMIARRAIRGQLWPLFELFDGTCARHRRIINGFLDPLIEKARKGRGADHQSNQSKRKGKKVYTDRNSIGPEQSRTLLDELVRSIDDPVVVRDELLSVLLAGRDTTASLLTFILYLLSTRPEVEDRLRNEIMEVCGDDGRQPTYAMIKQMRYLRAVLDETLRLFPPVPVNHRTSILACTLPPTTRSDDPDKRPYYVPPKTQVTYSPLVMQRLEALWGADANEFRPERWLDSKDAARYNNNFQFVPFNAGPRICLGLNLAYNEVAFLIAILLPKFKFRLASEYQPVGSLPLPEWTASKEAPMGRVREEKIWPFSTLTLHVKGGLWMSVERLDVDRAVRTR